MGSCGRLCRWLVYGCGAALIVLGFLDFHVQVGAIVVGLILVGCLSGERLFRFLGARALPPESEGEAPSGGRAPSTNGG